MFTAALFKIVKTWKQRRCSLTTEQIKKKWYIYIYVCVCVYIYTHTIKDRNGLDLTEAEDIKKRWQEYTEDQYKKYFTTQIIMMV